MTDWYMSLQDEQERGESYRLRMEAEEYEYWLERQRQEEIELLNSELVEDSFLDVGCWFPDFSPVATLRSSPVTQIWQS